jgi:hypothetical protein
MPGRDVVGFAKLTTLRKLERHIISFIDQPDMTEDHRLKGGGFLSV